MSGPGSATPIPEPTAAANAEAAANRQTRNQVIKNLLPRRPTNSSPLPSRICACCGPCRKTPQNDVQIIMLRITHDDHDSDNPFHCWVAR